MELFHSLFVYLPRCEKTFPSYLPVTTVPRNQESVHREQIQRIHLTVCRGETDREQLAIPDPYTATHFSASLLESFLALACGQTNDRFGGSCRSIKEQNNHFKVKKRTTMRRWLQSGLRNLRCWTGSDTAGPPRDSGVCLSPCGCVCSASCQAPGRLYQSC